MKEQVGVDEEKCDCICHRFLVRHQCTCGCMPSASAEPVIKSEREKLIEENDRKKEAVLSLIHFYEQRMEELEAQDQMDLWALCDDFVRQLKLLVAE